MDPSLTAKHGSTLIWATAGAILTAQLFPFDTRGYVPACAELLCWVLVVVWFEAVPRLSNGKWKSSALVQTQPLRWLPWGAAEGFTVVALSSSVVDIRWYMPAITPIITALRRTSLLPRLHSTLPRYLQSLWVQFGIGAISIIVLLPSLDYVQAAFSALAVVGLVGIYAVLIKIFELDADLSVVSVQLRIADVVRAVAVRTILLLLMLVVVLIFLLLPGGTLSISKVLLGGFAKATHWILLFWITQEVPWEIATTIWTCAASSTGKFAVNSSLLPALEALQPVSGTIVAFVALYQTISFLPKLSRGRYALFIFALWPIFPQVDQQDLLQRFSLPKFQTSIQNSTENKPATFDFHPIENLIIKAQADFNQLINRQSKSLSEAETEYQRRYSRHPPPGFDKWFSFAQERQSVIIDDFDIIHKSLEPFWKISPERLRESISYITGPDGKPSAFQKCAFENGTFHAHGHWLVDDLRNLLSTVTHDIPDVEFVLDVLDEPAEIVSQEVLEAGGVSQPEVKDEKGHPIWNRVIGPCLNKTSLPPYTGIDDYGIPFVQSAVAAKDVCQHPEFANQHGLFSSPTSAMLTNAPVPILSQSAPSSFGDIVYPSPWYAAKLRDGSYKEINDPIWEEKNNSLYWAGSTTGSHSHNGNWRNSHRQRFVELVQTLNSTSHQYLEQVKPGVWEHREGIPDDVDGLFDVKFTAVIQCDVVDCQQQEEHFHIGDREDQSHNFDSRFIFDMDGNSFSGRFYTLLQSRSTVLKQTVLREWHDERLVPWVHYVPVSLGMQELVEIMRFFGKSEDGEKRAREIAEQGREWAAKVLRRADFEVYLFRLMLELARVMDPNRVDE